ncbi:hypothetical protein [Streptococcus sp. sy010]|uniref:hypothetical protein n=1 Tax=Streptococcus sp. sy010 TaxID=2600148 RepID=UPI0011B49488|nr:hypothetical protein [Streptococcus sp. sy010]TWT16432.1 hypothetical protein FRX51_00525 [Streptococcus sp. sy010]
MSQELFEGYNEFLKERYGRTCSKETFKRFIQYCQKGVKENDVTPVLNPINLYAFGCGISSTEADKRLFLKSDTERAGYG